MQRSYIANLLVLTTLMSTYVFAGNLETPQDSVFIPSTSNTILLDNPNKEHLLKIVRSMVLHNKDKFVFDVKARRQRAFLLTGFIVYQTSRIVGHASIWTAAGASIVGGFTFGGPGGAAAAYLNAVATIGPASAAIETASLAIGTAASWIPGLP